jgi:uncharacterized membrane protein
MPSPNPSTLALAAVFFISASSAVPAITVTLEELPLPDGVGTAGVANIAADGTVVGTTWPDGYVVRWVPGAAPEVLGGGFTFTLENMMPLISRDGRTIATCGYFDNDDGSQRASPELWQGGTDWAEATGITLGDSTPFGMSADGATLAGSAFPPPDSPPGTPQDQPWTWTAPTGQVALGMLDGTDSGEAWAVSNDGTTAAGFFQDGNFTRRGVRWVDGAPEWILDADGANVGQAIACNDDCSVIVGAGLDASSSQAWRWTAAGGVEYLGAAPGASADALYYAFDTNADGTMIVGSYYTVDPLLGAVNRGFLWTPADHLQDLSAFLALYGIDYGDDFSDLVVNAMTPDGRALLINAANADYVRQRAVVHLEPDDAIFADGFDVTPI